MTESENNHSQIEKVKIIDLSTGVKVLCKPVSPFVVSTAMGRIEKPKVPKQFIESKGREEENPMHPDYLAALEKYDADRSQISQDVMFLMGTEVLQIPDGFQRPEDGDWAEDLALVGIVLSEDARRRRLEWLRYWAVRSVDDLQALSTAISRLSGVPEEEVEKAAESFRSDETQ